MEQPGGSSGAACSPSCAWSGIVPAPAASDDTQAPHAAAPTMPLARTMLIVRTHDPTPAMADRICWWARDAIAANCGFAVSVDATNPPGAAAATYLRMVLPPTAIVHAYTELDMMHAYPVLLNECVASADAPSGGQWRSWGACARGMPAAIPGVPSVEPLPVSVAWGFHSEAINLFVQFRLPPDAFDYFWVLEDDVGFTGDLAAEFCEAYASNPADLITSPIERVYSGSPWCWTNTGSAGFLSFIAPAQRRRSAEHCQRFSRGLLDELHRLSIGIALTPTDIGRPPMAVAVAPMTAWSEMSVPTICRYRGLTSTTLLESHVGTPFCFNGRVSSEQWQQLLASPEARCKLYHALKF